MNANRLQQAWDNIRLSQSAQVKHRPSLINQWLDKCIASEHKPLHNARRHTKGKAKGVGSVLIHSFVKQQVHIERVFPRFDKS